MYRGVVRDLDFIVESDGFREVYNAVMQELKLNVDWNADDETGCYTLAGFVYSDGCVCGLIRVYPKSVVVAYSPANDYTHFTVYTWDRTKCERKN